MREREDETQKSRKREYGGLRERKTVAGRMRSEVIKLNYYQS